MKETLFRGVEAVAVGTGPSLRTCAFLTSVGRLTQTWLVEQFTERVQGETLDHLLSTG